MRILHVVPTYLPAVRYGGPIFAVHGLCRALVSRGHQVEVYTTNVDGNGKSAVPTGVPINLDGVQVTYFSADLFRRLSFAPSLAQSLKREIAGFDIVHLHSVFLWPTWAAARLARKYRVPYLISPRGMLVKELVRRRSRVLKALWMTLIERSNLEQAAAVHVTSDLEKAELVNFNWRLPQISLVPNGVEEAEKVVESELSNDVKEIALRRPLVLFLGRISWKKGLERLIDAIALSNLGTLAVVGPDDEGLVPQLRRQAEKLRISDRVQFLPRTVMGSDKQHLFESASLFVLPSYSENFGNAVVEAMQNAVPVIVTPEVGSAKIVREAGAGLIAEGEPKSFGEAIGRILMDPISARSMGEAGKRYISAHHTWSRIAPQMEALYEMCCLKSVE